MNYIHPMCRRPPSITFFNYMRTNLQSDLNSFQNLRIGHCRIVWRGFPSLELWPQVVFSIHFRLSFKKRNSSRTHWVVHIDSWISSTLKLCLSSNIKRGCRWKEVYPRTLWLSSLQCHKNMKINNKYKFFFRKHHQGLWLTYNCNQNSI